MNFMTKKDNDFKDVESKRGTRFVSPATDIIENENDYTIIFDMPGIDKKDINLKVEKDVLTVTAETCRRSDDNFECIREESGYYSYRRSFNLNNIINTDKIDAEYKDGTLTLTLSKRENEKPKEIEIRVS